MTTNQTIDGVPRELLERLLIAVTQDFATIGEVRELRALLDAKSCSLCGKPTSCGKIICEDCCYEMPTVQPQNDPVAMFESVISKTPQAYLTEPVYQVTESEVREFARLLTEKPKNDPIAEVYRGPVSGISRIRWIDYKTAPVGTKLYAEQPAPVAVVLPERKTWDGLRATACNLKGEAWNACLDELKRLNTK
ncbi:hypothetical protein [Pseudomonas sp.]|uniref:hypothetical protein n=1 Tax=Pseudomonas sp. TaxID=306 RepID=UPI003FD842EA